MENHINQDTCTQCQVCVEICPCHIFGINDRKEVTIIPERESICIACGHCMAICEPEAVSIERLSYEKDFFDLPENSVVHPNFMNFLATRRSVRNFRNKPVPNSVMDQILDAISFAPFGASPIKMHITVINKRAKIEEALPHIAEFLDNIVGWIENPFTSFLIKRRKGAETFNTVKNHLYPISKMGNYKLEYGDRITPGAPALLIFHAEKEAEEHTHNALIFATYTMLAAHSLGLGTSMIGIIPNAINKVKKVREIFRIPENHEAVMSLIFGYPKYHFQKAIKRDNHQIHWVS